MTSLIAAAHAFATHPGTGYEGPAALGDAAEQAAERAADRLLRAAGIEISERKCALAFQIE